MKYYLQSVDRIRERAEGLDPFATVDRLQQFSFFSANLSNFLPLMPSQRHGSLYKEAYINQQLCFLEQGYFDRELPVQVEGWDGGIIDRLKAQPGIICTFHAGSYRLLSYLLAREQLPYAVLMSEETGNTQGHEFKKLYADFHKGHGLKELPLVYAEDPAAVWQLVRLSKRGYHLLVYLDGDKGMPANRQEKLAQVPFFAQHVYARKGVAFLSQKLQLPLYPIFCFRKSDGNIRVFHDQPILPLSSSAEFGQLALTRMFAFFSQHLVHHPAQWENWFFLHFQLETACLLDAGRDGPRQGELDKDDLPSPLSFGLYTAGGGYFLLEKWGYKSYVLTKKSFRLLWEHWKGL